MSACDDVECKRVLRESSRFMAV